MVKQPRSETVPTENVAIELFIAGFPWRIQTLAQRLRTTVRSVFPEAEERMRPGWRVIKSRQTCITSCAQPTAHRQNPKVMLTSG